MAMNLRPRGGATRRTRPGNQPVYEDFRPTTELKHEEGADLVLYHLPGFSKEQIRIIAESKGVLKVRGERNVTSNRWSRFQEQVVVPEDCNMNEVRAKFEAGILRIIMPKKAIAVDTKHPVVQEPALPPKPHPRASLPRPDVVQPKPPTELPSKRQAALPTVDETPQFGTMMHPPQQPNNTQLDAPATSRAPLKPAFDFKPQPQSSHDNIQHHIPDYLKPRVVEDRKAHDDGSTSSTHIAGRHSKGRMQEKHEDNKYVDALGDQKKERNYGGLSNMNRLDNQLNVIVGRFSKKLGEDGHLLVNAGAAILLIIALGMYISYSFGLRD